MRVHSAIPKRRLQRRPVEGTKVPALDGKLFDELEKRTKKEEATKLQQV